MKLLLLTLNLAFIALSMSARQLSFDRGWRFTLCKDSATLVTTLHSLGVNDNPLAEGNGGKRVTINKVTDDTEPEQAQVTASAITQATTLSAFSKEMTEVNIPHDWSIELPFDGNMGGSAGYLAGGQGVYVKDFSLPKGVSGKGKKCIIQFDGVYHRATVWVNGTKVGYHVYGYTGFEYDITPYIYTQKENRIVVHVNREEQSRWYTGSGIYRHVWIHSLNETHIKRGSIFVTSSPAADGSATVNVQAAIDTAAADRGKGFYITHTILTTVGKMGKNSIKTTSGSGSLTIKNAKLWSVDEPNMYTLRTQLRTKNGKVVDEIDTPFGIRDIRFDADKGFFLNGKSMKLKGMCLHQDMGSLGVAVPDEALERRLKALKAIGCNAIRCSHNPPSPEFLTICDTLGLLVIDEAFDKWKSGYYAPFFDECAKNDIADMVIRDRNHPSVMLWSIGNEVSEAWLDSDEGVERGRMLHNIVKSLDPTRLTMIGCQQGFKDKFGEVADVVGYNYLEPRMIADHKRHPQRKMLVSEAFVYYSGLREELVRDFVEKNPWHFVENNDFIAGSFVWAGVDYLGESSPWPAKGWCSCPFDMTLQERPQAAFYHTAWQKDKDYLKLVVRDNCFDQAMGTDHWQYPPMADTWDLPYKDSRCVQIRCYTTCDSVQFYFPMWTNPQLPLKKRARADYDDNCITIQLPAREGKILAVGYKDGKEVMRDSLINHGAVSNVKLEVDNQTLGTTPTDWGTGKSSLPQIAHIRLTLTDKEGRKQQMQPRSFRVETEGNIRLLGVETGDMRRDVSWRTTELKTYFGEGFIRVQSTPEPGKGKVKVFVEGFEKPFEVDFTAQMPTKKNRFR